MIWLLKTAVSAVGFVWSVAALVGGAAVFWISVNALFRKTGKKPPKLAAMAVGAAVFGALSAAHGVASIAAAVGAL